jgi:CRISPR system Cascade subunit CasC
MTSPLFIQIHTLTAYPASLLNRDDVGFAKRIPFGGATRTRVSSQCLKRHWRTFQGDHSLASLTRNGEPVATSVRSRLSFERFVLGPLLEAGVSPELARAATEAVMVEVLGESAKAKKAKEDAKSDDAPKAKKKGAKKEGDEDGGASLQTGQITVLGRPELEFFLAEARALANDAGSVEKLDDAKKKRFGKDWRKNLDGLRMAAGLDAALFGRMVTSDKLARADAAVHVAHAFTVHAEHTETDYFSAVDDLLGGRDDDAQLGSGHIGTTELTSGLFYGYAVVDVAQLVSNLEGCSPSAWEAADRKLAADVVASLVQLAARVTPGAKKGSTAPYAYSNLVLVESGTGQPRTLANAFLDPVSEKTSLLSNAYSALAGYVLEVDEAYGLANQRSLMAIGPKDRLAGLGTPASLDALAKAAGRAILEHR